MLRFGASIWPQGTRWSDMRDAAVLAEASGWDALWVFDHLLAVNQPWEQPIFEAWLVSAAWAMLTQRVTLGLMVSSNTFRNPGHTAKLVTTLDHISGGRAILGIGGGWFEREHQAYGIEFGKAVGERLDRLDEAAHIIKRLLSGERFSHAGRFYTFDDAFVSPGPVGSRIPLLVGGAGRRKTLHTVAAYADAWNTKGFLDQVTQNVRNLEAHCRTLGRDPASIERTFIVPMLIRDDREAAEKAFATILQQNGVAPVTDEPTLLGPPEVVAAALRPYRELGFNHFISRLHAPHDRETIARIGEVRSILDTVSA